MLSTASGQILKKPMGSRPARSFAPQADVLKLAVPLSEGVTAMCGTPQGALAGSAQGSVKLWGWRRGEKTLLSPPHTAAVLSVCALHGSLAASSSRYDGVIAIWDLAIRERVASRGDGGDLCCLLDGRLASATTRGVVILGGPVWETLLVIPDVPYPARFLVPLGGGKLGVMHDSSLRILDADTGETVESLRPFADTPANDDQTCLALPDASVIVANGAAASLLLPSPRCVEPSCGPLPRTPEARSASGKTSQRTV
jgi:WD40 repeat protein